MPGFFQPSERTAGYVSSNAAMLTASCVNGKRGTLLNERHDESRNLSNRRVSSACLLGSGIGLCSADLARV
jgi:hypothetical protein